MQLSQNIAARQDDVQTDIAGVNSLFDKLLAALNAVHEEVGGIGELLRRNLARTHHDLVAARQQLCDLQNTAATLERMGALTHETVERVGASTQRATQESIERLGVAMQHGFTLIEARITSGNRRQGGRDQLAARLNTNPHVFFSTRLPYSQEEQLAADSSAHHSSVMVDSSQVLVSQVPREVASLPVIAGAFVLAIRADTGNERAMYAMLTLLLFLTSKMLQLYKTPTISHVIFVVDMFDVCIEVIFSNATSSAVSCTTCGIQYEI